MSTTPTPAPKPKRSFLRVFSSVLHGLEAAATIAAPILAAVEPEIAPLVSQAVSTAVVIEQVAAPGMTGAQKAAVVASATQAGITLTNSLLASQGKGPLPIGVDAAVGATVKNVVDTLNGVADAVMPVAQ